MEPKDFFKKKVIGQLTTRKIDRLSIEGVPTSIKDETTYDVIDIVVQDGHKLYVTNTWENATLNVVLAIHNNFVKEQNCDEEQRDRLIEQGFRHLGGEDILKKPVLPKGSGLGDREN